MQHLLYTQLFTLKQKLDARSDMSLFWYVYPLCVILNIIDESVASDVTAASPKVPAEGLPGMVSLSSNENENSRCHSSPSQRWEGRMRQHAEPNSPAAKDKSSHSWIRLLETPHPVLNRWLITFNVVTASCIPLVSLVLCRLRSVHVSGSSAARRQSELHDFLFRTDLHLTEGATAANKLLVYFYSLQKAKQLYFWKSL